MNTAAPAKRKVPVINASIEVEVSPGERCVWLRDEQVRQHFGVFAWQKLGDGTYAPVVRIYDTYVRINEVQSVGIPIPWDTLRRLATAGFVDYRQPAPNTIYICIESLVQHMEATRDPEFWTADRRARYAAACR